ncbi:Ni,Fe-hydrogenase III small subunit [Desulfosarcina cetonica]|uniref:NADH-quinone oxidoreductase subunit NuoB n=1 Tax=Desulfosarcina cetonica TaxID=90730 RepID=UPI0006CFFACE|nr:NADH-quinone oxidoreductase subunit NuoB [Desulfosarcina cetonica]VTR64881.1 Ni,Fe-hydrogenase III small subunit [Desulfosarcina cetonica]
MLSVLKNRFEQGCRTSRYPKVNVQLPSRYRGRPVVNADVPADLAEACAAACPQEAIDAKARTLHLGRCVFCGNCERISGGQFVRFTQNFENGVAEKAHLVTQGDLPDLAAHARQHFKGLFGRSLQLRQVSAAGCNACEADLNVLATPFFDLARFGINFVASPRHADGIVVTGPISRNMKTALMQTYEATPQPRVVIAVGSCALSGGPFRGSNEITEGLDSLLPVDLFIPGCPPHPMTNLHALLTFFK